MSKLLEFAGSAKFAAILTLLAAFIVYMPFLNQPAHLDDQFLLYWLTHMKGTQAEFFNWSGPDRLDAWGPTLHFWFIAKAIFLKKSVALWRLAGLLIHCLSSLVIYFIIKRLRIENAAFIALATSLLFAVYPLHPEAVFWISGKASELSALFFLSALYFFLRSKTETKLRYLPLFAGLTLLILGLTTQFTFSVSHHALDFSKWYHLIRNLFFPINNEIVPKYPREYRFLYFLFAPCLLALPIAIWKDKRFGKQVLIAFILLIILCLPYVGLATDLRNLYGSRFLYLATFPTTLLLALILSSFSRLNERFKIFTTCLSGIFLLLLFGFFFRMAWLQNSAYKQATHVLASIQKSANVVVAKTAVPYVFIRDLPRNTSIVPAPLEYSVAALNGQTGLLSCWVVPPERLKRTLLQGNNLPASLRWDKDFLSLVAFDLTPRQDKLLELDGPGIVARMMPGLIFYRTASYDEANKYLVLESNSTTSGPAVRLSADGLSPIDSEIFYIDAMIQAPVASENQEVELYWTTRLYDDYNHHDRRSFVRAIVNDGQFHRYYLPLSGQGFYANGTIAALTLGFPAGSKVSIKGLGTSKSDNLVAELSLASLTANQCAFQSPYFQYPQIAELGLCQLAKTESLALNYSVANIVGAVSASLEIGKPNEFFNNPNGNALSAACLKQIPIASTKGQLNLSGNEFKTPAVYSLRIIGKGLNGETVGNFSDSINVLVR